MHESRPESIAWCVGSLLFFCAFLVVGGCTSKSPHDDPFGDYTRLLHLPPGDTEIKQGKDPSTSTFVWEDGSSLVAINTFLSMSDDEAARLLADKKLLMDSLFEEHRSPYAGNSTNKESCPKAFLPIIHDFSSNDMKLLAYETAANRRFVFGGCTAETRELLAVYALMYCPERETFLEVRFFTPPAHPLMSPKAFIDLLRCS